VLGRRLQGWTNTGKTLGGSENTLTTATKVAIIAKQTRYGDDARAVIASQEGQCGLRNASGD
jgi:hypothetical protein